MSESRTKSRKASVARTTRRSPSPSYNSVEAEERMYRKMAKKAGVKALTEDQKRRIQNALNSASVSGSVDKEDLLDDLKGIKGIVKEQKEKGRANHAEGLARRTRRADRLKAKYEMQKEEIVSELKALSRTLGKKISAKGTLHLAKLRAHGFELPLEHHVHLTKHLADKTTQRIKERLSVQERKNHCKQCVLEDYLTIV